MNTICNKNRIIKITGLLFALLLLTFMLSGITRAVFAPKDINYYENRGAKKIGELTFKTYINSEFQDSMEEALADQIPFAQPMKKLYNTVNSKLLVKALLSNIEKHPDTFFEYNGMIFYDGYILWVPFNLDDCRAEFEETAESINQAMKNNPETPFYIYYGESDSIIDFRTGEKTPVYEYIRSLLDISDENISRFEINDFETYSELYYKTDHHWNYKGSYKGYTEVMKLLGCEDELMQPLDEIELPYYRAGSKSKECGLTELKEYYTVYKFEYPDYGVKYGNEEEIISGELQDFSYELFYGGNYGTIVLDTKRPEKENIIVIGDSFDNAILKLVASHYNKTISIDMRNLDLPEGQSLNITDVIRDNDVDKVLIMASQVVFSSGEFILES